MIPAYEPRGGHFGDGGRDRAPLLAGPANGGFLQVLKSGSRVGHLALRTSDRLNRVIVINRLIARSLMLMTLLEREVPECEPGLEVHR